jgi:AraC-like DNA-binding protein
MVRLQTEGVVVIDHWTSKLAPQIGRLPRDTVSANFVQRVVRGAVNLGASRPRLLDAIHVNDAVLRNPIWRFDRALLVNLFAAIEREFADPAMPMRMAIIARPGCFSDLGYIALFAPTLGDMIAETVSIQGMRQNIWRAELDKRADRAVLRWNLPDPEPGQLEAAIEFSTASYIHLFRSVLPGGMPVLAVHYHHQPRFAVPIYEQLLGCPVEFGAEQSSVIFDAGRLARPSPCADARVQAAILERYNRAMDWMEQGRRHSALCYMYLTAELNKSPLKLERLAASFAMTERTLRRRLVEEELSFRDLLEQVRRDFCDLYRLEGKRPMGEIAELLGYAELSAFTRAHRRWYGQPPTRALK